MKRDTTTHLSEWPKSETPMTPNGGENVEQQELPYVAGGNAKGPAVWKTVGCFFPKAKQSSPEDQTLHI